jgi:hypothetical protein
MVFDLIKNAQNWVDEKIADVVGAELSLGATDDPKLLVNGEPATIAETAAHLSKLGAAFGETAKGFAEIDVSHWTGDAADAFRAKFQESPKQWVAAADAFQEAGAAFEGYVGVVKWAQDQAKQAADLYRKAEQASQDAADRYNAQAAQATEAMPPFNDPGNADRLRAQEMLAAARRQRDSAAEQAQHAIEAATAKAPQEPSFVERMMDEITDQTTMVGDAAVHVVEGAAEGVEGILKFARSLNPMDPYNVTHPASYVDGLSNTAAGLLHSVVHPVDLVKGLVGTGWGSDPAEALGKLLPNIALGALTDGAGTAAEAGSVAARTAGSVAETTATRAAGGIAETTAGRTAAGTAESTAAKTMEAVGAEPHYPGWNYGSEATHTVPERPPVEYPPKSYQPRWHDDPNEEIFQDTVYDQSGWGEPAPRPSGEYTPEDIDPRVFDDALAKQAAAHAKIEALPGGTTIQSAETPRPPVETHVFESASGKLDTTAAPSISAPAFVEGDTSDRARQTEPRHTPTRLFRPDVRTPAEVFVDGFSTPSPLVTAVEGRPGQWLYEVDPAFDGDVPGRAVRGGYRVDPLGRLAEYVANPVQPR